MQDIISKMSDTDIKPMVDPSPPRDTTVTIADGGTPPLDDTTYDLLLRADTRSENRKLRHIINEPGPNNQDIYQFSLRKLLEGDWGSAITVCVKCGSTETRISKSLRRVFRGTQAPR